MNSEKVFSKLVEDFSTMFNTHDTTEDVLMGIDRHEQEAENLFNSLIINGVSEEHNGTIFDNMMNFISFSNLSVLVNDLDLSENMKNKTKVSAVRCCAKCLSYVNENLNKLGLDANKENIIDIIHKKANEVERESLMEKAFVVFGELVEKECTSYTDDIRTEIGAYGIYIVLKENNALEFAEEIDLTTLQ